MVFFFFFFFSKKYLKEYECFDLDFCFFNSLQIPPSFYEFHDENKEKKGDTRVLKGLLAEINCVYLIIDKSLYLWRYMEDTGQTDEIKVDNIYNPNIQNTPAKIFSFGPYEEEIRAVNVCKPSAHIFLQADIKLVFVIGFSTAIQLYNLKIDEKSIAMESLEVNVKIKGEIETVLNFFLFNLYLTLFFFLDFLLKNWQNFLWLFQWQNQRN